MMKKLKILHVTEAFGGGVLEYFTILLNQENINHDHHLLVCKRNECSYDFTNRFHPKANIYEIVRDAGFLGGLLTLFKLATAIKRMAIKEEFDIVHLHSTWAGFLGRIALWFCPSVKIVYTPHGLSFLNKKAMIKSWFYYCVEWLLAGGKSAILACSHSELEKLNGFRSPKAFLRNPAPCIDLSKIIPHEKFKPTFLIIGIGRLCEQKNPHLFAEASRTILAENLNVKIIWIGDGEPVYLESLRTAGVEVLGWLAKSELFRYMASANLILSTSTWEGLPLTLTEALALGIPVVATDCVGNVDAVQHGVNGFLATDLRQICFFVQQIIESPSLQILLSKGAVNLCKNKFLPSEYARKIELFYEEYFYRGICIGDVGNTKIVYVVESLAGGVINSIRIASESILDRGVDFFVINSIREDTPSEYIKLFDKRVRFYTVDMTIGLGVFFAAIKIRKIINKISPQVVHLHSSIAGGLGRLLIPFVSSGIRFFYSPRGFSFLQKRGVKSRLYYLAEIVLSFTNCKIIACSQSELSLALKMKADSILIENARPVDLFSDYKKVNDPSMPVVVATVGRVKVQKNPLLFSSLADQILLGNKNVSFLWVGSGDLHFEEILSKSDVKLTGWVDECVVKKYLDQIDIYVQTASYEGMPLSVIEAQLSGIPCVVMDVVGSRDVVVHNVTGFVAKNENELFYYVDLLISDVDLRRKLGAQAFESSKYRFSINRLGNDLSNLYNL